MTTQVSESPLLPSLREAAGGGVALAERIPLSLVQLAARVAVATIFWKSAQTKLANWDLTVALFADEYKVPVLPPELAAYLGTTMELVCPVLLFLGLAARLGALGLLGMTFVIQTFVYPGSWVEHLTWASMLLLILARGAGTLSIDHLIRRRLARSN